MTAPMLREYQTDAIQRIRLAVTQGSKSILAVSPTGSGKTTIGGAIAASAAGRGKRVLWLAHRNELVDQAFDRLREFDVNVGAITSTGSRPPNPYHPAQVAMIQTLLARNERPAADIVIWDECHHSPSDEWIALAKHYDRSILVGLTATPERSDGRGLGNVFDRIVVVASVQQLTDMGHLVPCEIVRPGRRLRAGSIAQRPVDAYLQHARGRRTICFSPSVKAAEQHAEEMNGLGVTARVVHGDMPAAERKLYLDTFKHGGIQVLVNVYVLTEGFDDPAVSAVILARGCGTAGTFLQMTGRGLRPAAGKTDCLLIDLHGVSYVHGHPADDRQYSLDGRGISGADVEVDPQSSCRVCGAPINAGEACAECGTAPKEIEPPKVTGDPLVKYAAKRAEPEEKRVATLARWIADAAGRGHKPGAALGKFKAVYGAWPTWSQQQQARELLSGKEKVA